MLIHQNNQTGPNFRPSAQSRRGSGTSLGLTLRPLHTKSPTHLLVLGLDEVEQSGTGNTQNRTQNVLAVYFCVGLE